MEQRVERLVMGTMKHVSWQIMFCSADLAVAFDRMVVESFYWAVDLHVQEPDAL
jgi:hypothetical protein